MYTRKGLKKELGIYLLVAASFFRLKKREQSMNLCQVTVPRKKTCRNDFTRGRA